jgi:hypothetical protein
MREVGFEPTMGLLNPLDLQSSTFGRFATPTLLLSAEGFEPTTYGLKVQRSTN